MVVGPQIPVAGPRQHMSGANGDVTRQFVDGMVSRKASLAMLNRARPP